MPNWSDNRLAIAGNPRAVMLLVEELAGPDSPLDFEQLLPTPPALLVRDDQPPREVLPDWYFWRREHWGVKWNASDVVRQGYGRTGRVRYRFLTPNGPPAAFFDVVAARYPELDIALDFEVEGAERGFVAWAGGRRELSDP